MMYDNKIIIVKDRKTETDNNSSIDCCHDSCQRYSNAIDIKHCSIRLSPWSKSPVRINTKKPFAIELLCSNMQFNTCIRDPTLSLSLLFNLLLSECIASLGMAITLYFIWLNKTKINPKLKITTIIIIIKEWTE